MKNLKPTTLLLCNFLFSLTVFGQSIPQNFFGQNAWYTVYTNDGQEPDINNAFINYIADVKASGAKFCRIGGANANIQGNIIGGIPTFIPITREQVLYLRYEKLAWSQYSGALSKSWKQ